jgi:cytoskeletal protein RodZ
MKNMNDKTKKWMLVAGGLALSAVLVVAIAGQFKTEKPTDAPLPSQSSSVSDVTVDPNRTDNTEKEKDVLVQIPDATQSVSSGNGAVDTGTEQTIQGDVTKPEYTEEELKNPEQKPNGDSVTENDKVQDHDKVETPVAPPAPSKPGGGNSIPGFNNVPNAGANQGEYVDGDGDINKQVGTMD